VELEKVCSALTRQCEAHKARMLRRKECKRIRNQNYREKNKKAKHIEKATFQAVAGGEILLDIVYDTDLKIDNLINRLNEETMMSYKMKNLYVNLILKYKDPNNCSVQSKIDVLSMIDIIESMGCVKVEEIYNSMIEGIGIRFNVFFMDCHCQFLFGLRDDFIEHIVSLFLKYVEIGVIIGHLSYFITQTIESNDSLKNDEKYMYTNDQNVMKRIDNDAYEAICKFVECDSNFVRQWFLVREGSKEAVPILGSSGHTVKESILSNCSMFHYLLNPPLPDLSELFSQLSNGKYYKFNVSMDLFTKCYTGFIVATLIAVVEDQDRPFDIKHRSIYESYNPTISLLKPIKYHPNPLDTFNTIIFISTSDIFNVHISAIQPSTIKILDKNNLLTNKEEVIMAKLQYRYNASSLSNDNAILVNGVFAKVTNVLNDLTQTSVIKKEDDNIFGIINNGVEDIIYSKFSNSKLLDFETVYDSQYRLDFLSFANLISGRSVAHHIMDRMIYYQVKYINEWNSICISDNLEEQKINVLLFNAAVNNNFEDYLNNEDHEYDHLFTLGIDYDNGRKGLFDFKNIIIVCQDRGRHWYFYQINPKNTVNEKNLITIFCSSFKTWKRDYSKTTSRIKQFLCDEATEKLKDRDPLVAADYQDWEIRVSEEMPKQTNEFDSGIYVLVAMDCIIHNIPLGNISKQLLNGGSIKAIRLATACQCVSNGLNFEF
jgi:hypothetical protein